MKSDAYCPNGVTYIIADPLPDEWWWLSFADPYLPEGTQFLGAIIVKAQGFGMAVVRVNMLGINPGGEVVGYSFPKGKYPPLKDTDRLLSKAKIDALEFSEYPPTDEKGDWLA